MARSLEDDKERMIRVLKTRMENLMKKGLQFEVRICNFETESSPLMDEFLRINTLIYRLKIGESPQEILLEILSYD
jgi:hypothetical protein